LQSYLVDTIAILNTHSSDTWPAFVGVLPDDFPNKVPINAVGIFDTAGRKDARVMQGSLISKRGIQITIRSSEYETGWAKSEALGVAIDAILDAVVTDSVGSYLIENASRTGSVNSLGIGEKRENLFTINLMLTLRTVI
jgi:hypothetical protein